MGNKNAHRVIDTDIPEGNGICLFGNYLPHEPRDILRYIFSYVPPRSLIVSASRTCKYWSEVLSDPHFWMHKIQADGIVDIPETTQTVLLEDTDPLFAARLLKMISSGHLPLNKNIIKNPSGTNNFVSWGVLHEGDGLKIECPPFKTNPIPEEAGLPTQHCFASSYGFSKRQQFIKLQQYGLTPEAIDKLKPKFVISEWVCARPDCKAESRIDLTLLGKKYGERIAVKWSSDDEGVSYGKWYQVKKTVENYPEDLYEIGYRNLSKDRQFLAGHYGTKTAGSSLKIVLLMYLIQSHLVL